MANSYHNTKQDPFKDPKLRKILKETAAAYVLQTVSPSEVPSDGDYRAAIDSNFRDKRVQNIPQVLVT